MKSRWLILAALLPGVLAAAPGAQQESPAFSLFWARSDAPEGVRGIYPHRTDPRLAWATTIEGLWRTEDEGRTWRALPGASAEKIGRITSLAVCPADGDRLVAGTAENGCWLSADGGATWQKLGQPDNRPAAEQIACVAFGVRDPSWKTLFVTHGQAKTGMSITRDLGKTWEVVGADRYFASVTFSGWTIVAAGSMAETDGKTWGLHRSAWDGQRWEEALRDCRPVEGGETALRPNMLFFCTLDGKILFSSDDGESWTDRAPENGGHWVSVFSTWGSTQSTEILAAYNPEKLGLVLSETLFKGAAPARQNTGLRISPLVKSGASCRASANGMTWYVVMNDALWIGRRQPRPDAPTIVQVRCEPPTLWVNSQGAAAAEDELHRRMAAVATAADVQDSDVKALAATGKSLEILRRTPTFLVLAQVLPAKGAAIKSVTADLTVAGGPASAELFDDGQHGDGQSNDGLWGRQVNFAPRELPGNDRRWGLPGHSSAMTITVIDAAGHSDTRSAVLAAYVQVEPLQLIPHGITFHNFREIVSGPAAAKEVRNGKAGEPDALRLDATGPGPWQAGWRAEDRLPLAGYQWLQFDIRGAANQEVCVHLVDHFQRGEDFMDVPRLSAGVPLLAGGYLKAVTGQYQTVRIPIGKLLPPGTQFVRQYGAGLALSAKAGGGPGQYDLTNVRLLP